jgi:hypothetical protein
MVDPLINYMRIWWRGPLNLFSVYREIGVSMMDNANFVRDFATDESFETLFSYHLRFWTRRNWYLSNALYSSPSTDSLQLFDRISFDLDSENKNDAINEALAFARRLEDLYDATAIVVDTGFKGAHIHVFLSETVDWERYQMLYSYLMNLFSRKDLVDKNMLQPNRLVRIPLTYNLKNNERRRALIIYPEKILDFNNFSWDIIEVLDISRVKLYHVSIPIHLPKKITLRRSRSSGAWEWVEKIIELGLPDGRKRFILMVLSPYLVNIKKLSQEEALEEIKRFIENSCRNHSNCSKIYESWYRGDLQRVKNKGVAPLSLKKLSEKDPELHQIITAMLEKQEKTNLTK